MSEDDKWGARVIEQIFSIWITPEVERRKSEGRLAKDFVLWAAQVVFNVGQKPMVRLNEEIKALLTVKVDRVVQPGDPVVWSDLNDIHDIQLSAADPNAGHITIVKSGRGWQSVFDSRYNAERANECLDAAQEFFSTASEALQAGRLRAFAENLFGATELAVKAKLLTVPDEQILKSRKHGIIAGKYNRWVKWGNTARENAKLLKRLMDLRSHARYVDGEFTLEADEAGEMLNQAEKLLEEAASRIPPRRRAPSS